MNHFPTANKLFLRIISILDHIWWCWHTKVLIDQNSQLSNHCNTPNVFMSAWTDHRLYSLMSAERKRKKIPFGILRHSSILTTSLPHSTQPNLCLSHFWQFFPYWVPKLNGIAVTTKCDKSLRGYFLQNTIDWGSVGNLRALGRPGIL